MHCRRKMRLAALGASVAFAWPAVGHAETVSPLDAGATAPALTYESAFEGYRAMHDVEPKPWREVNETVRTTGGMTHGGDPAVKKPEQPMPAQPTRAPQR